MWSMKKRKLFDHVNNQLAKLSKRTQLVFNMGPSLLWYMDLIICLMNEWNEKSIDYSIWITLYEIEIYLWFKI